MLRSLESKLLIIDLGLLPALPALLTLNPRPVSILGILGKARVITCKCPVRKNDLAVLELLLSAPK